MPLGRQFAGAAVTERTWLTTLSEVLLGLRDAAIVAGLAFSVGALLYYWLLYRSYLVPQLAVGLGDRRTVPDDVGVQEMALAVWLIVRGVQLRCTRGRREAGSPLIAAVGDQR